MFLVLTALAVILGLFVLLARRIRRRGLTGGVVSVAEELYRPSAQRSRIVIQVEAAATPSTPTGQDPAGRCRSG